MISALVLPSPLRDQLFREARAQFPRECCGLIEGVRDGDKVTVTTLHPTRNLATAQDRFEIDPVVQFRLMREPRGTGREIVGCYHSHPNGRAEPSERDREFADEDGFAWLIAALEDAARTVALAAFVPERGIFTRVAILP